MMPYPNQSTVTYTKNLCFVMSQKENIDLVSIGVIKYQINKLCTSFNQY